MVDLATTASLLVTFGTRGQKRSCTEDKPTDMDGRVGGWTERWTDLDELQHHLGVVGGHDAPIRPRPPGQVRRHEHLQHLFPFLVYLLRHRDVDQHPLHPEYLVVVVQFSFFLKGFERGKKKQAPHNVFVGRAAERRQACWSKLSRGWAVMQGRSAPTIVDRLVCCGEPVSKPPINLPAFTHRILATCLAWPTQLCRCSILLYLPEDQRQACRKSKSLGV